MPGVIGQKKAGERRTKLYGLRMAKRLPIAKVSTATGISANALSMYERDMVTPLVSTAIALARFFGVTVEEMFG